MTRLAWRTGPALAAGVLATLACALLVCCRGQARADSAGTDRVVRWWAAVCLRAAGARMVVHGLEHVKPATAYVVVSNHQSGLDPIVHLHALPLPLRILTMRGLFRIPLLGRALRIIGMIEVNRGSPDRHKINADAARAIGAGHSLLIYPEGVISPDGAIGDFKNGAFIMAAAHQVPILPVAIDGTRDVWPPGRHGIRSGPVRIAIGPPLPPRTESAIDGVAAARDRARELIASAHQDLARAVHANPTPTAEGPT